MRRINLYKILLAVFVAFCPIITLLTIPAPAYATSANFTAASTYCINYNTVTSTWNPTVDRWVGCVSSCNDTRYGMGIRFTAVNIPQGATINSAYLAVTSSGNYIKDTVNSLIQGEDADTAAAFTTVANYQGRTRTTAYTTWNGISHWSNGVEYLSDDISDVVQEITDRTAWVSGNNMVIFWDDHNAYSSQSCIIGSIIRGGTTIKLVVDYTAAAAVVAPTITIVDASNVGSSSASLNLFVNSDGNDPNDVAVRWGYATATHSTNFSAYTTITAWSTDNYTTGTAVSLPITGLTAGIPYYFNAQAQNSAGTTTGTESTFTTPSLSGLSPSNFILLPSADQVSLQWVLPSGYSQSVLRYSANAIPADNTSGSLLLSSSATSYTHAGLVSGTTYGYRVWGVESGSWSTSATGIVTTKGTASTSGLSTPTSPFRWLTDTDYTTMNRTFFYPIVNNIGDSLSMPRDTAWVSFALGITMLIGFITWAASRSMTALTIGVCVGIVIGWGQHILPLYLAFFAVLFGIGIIAIRERI